MSTSLLHPPSTFARTRDRLSDPVFQAFALLRTVFTVAPILFGLDKFLDWLVDWRIYLAPEVNELIPGDAHQAMLLVGVIEIVAGLVVALRPKWGGYLVAAWLGGIIVNLLLLGDHYDVALRDFGLLVAALALARLATVAVHSPSEHTGRTPSTKESPPVTMQPATASPTPGCPTSSPTSTTSGSSTSATLAATIPSPSEARSSIDVAMLSDPDVPISDLVRR